MNSIARYARKSLVLSAAALLAAHSQLGPALADHVLGHDEVARGGIKALEQRVFDLENAPAINPGIQAAIDNLQSQIGTLTSRDDSLQAQIDALQTVLSNLQAQFDAIHGTKLVFTTSEKFNGAEVGQGMGALGGDAHCQRLASAAGHMGTFMAWLSDATTSPSARFIQSTIPYALVDGTTIADDYTDLTDLTIQAPINLDEFGFSIDPAERIFTATFPDGSPVPNTVGLPVRHNCDQWSSTDIISPAYAASLVTDPGWSGASGAASCAARHPLYCFQQ